MKQSLSVFLLLLCNFFTFGADTLRDFLESQTRYWGIHETIKAADMDKLIELKQKADQPGLTSEVRTKAYSDLFQFVQKLRGFPEGKTPAAMAASNWSEERSPLPTSLESAKPGQLGNFKKRGEGKISMILIPDLGTDWTVFDSFMQRNHSHFTFYAVTLPGFGGTAPPPSRKRLDFGPTEWWNNAEVAILDLISTQKLSQPIILGQQAGAYLAMKLALKHPDLIRGAVVLNGLLYAELPGIPKDATPEERAPIVNSWTPVELFPTPSQANYKTLMLQYAPWLCKDKKRQESLADLTSRGRPSTWWNYYAELATTNLSTEMKTLKVPMLVLPSIHGSDSPGFESSKTTLDQWKPFDHSASSLPITVIPMENSRGYATEDQPAKLDEAVHNWMSSVVDQKKTKAEEK